MITLTFLRYPLPERALRSVFLQTVARENLVPILLFDREFPANTLENPFEQTFVLPRHLAVGTGPTFDVPGPQECFWIECTEKGL